MTESKLTTYPAWRQTYSSEDYNRIQQFASKLTQADRDAGRKAPKYGCSQHNLDIAEKAVKAAQY